MQVQDLQSLTNREVVSELEFNTNAVIRHLCLRLVEAENTIEDLQDDLADAIIVDEVVPAAVTA
jgi:hypothetical protein